MSGSEPFHGWPDKATHDRVAAAYYTWLIKQYGGRSPYALHLNTVKPGYGSLCGCCGVGTGVPNGRYISPGTPDSIRHSPLKNGVVDCPEGWDHIVIRDKDVGDMQITWRDV